MTYEGWIKEYRKLLNNPLIKKPLYCHLWNVLLLLAQHKKTEFIWSGEKWTLEKGQLLTSRKKLSDFTGISESQIERILKYLENEHQITQLKTNKFRVITIVNWDKYQYEAEEEQQPDNRGHNNRTTEGQQKDTYNNDKNVKNEKNVYKGDTHNLSKPTNLEQVKEYFIQEKIDIAPDYFWGFYEKKGWMVGKSKMTNWHIAAGQARSWDNAPKNPDLEHTGKTRLCGCGCGRTWNIDAGSEVFYNSECRKKVLGW